MTRTIDEAFAASGNPDRHRSRGRPGLGARSAVVEQAKGALVFRYSVGPEAAFSVIELWAAEAAVGVEEVARAIVCDICQGDARSGSDPGLVRWIQDRLRQEVSPLEMSEPDEPEPEPEASGAVVVAVDHSDVSLDAVVEATRNAARLGVALQIAADPQALPEDSAVSRDHLQQRIDLAVELARALEPELEVLAPAEILTDEG